MRYSSLALAFAVVGGALGQLFLKAGLMGSGTEGVIYSVVNGSAMAILLFAVGILFYGASMVAWIIALTRYELCFAYPLLSLGYLIVYVGALVWPGMTDTFSLQKTMGILLIVIGVAISSQKSNPGLWFRYAIPKKL